MCIILSGWTVFSLVIEKTVNEVKSVFLQYWFGLVYNIFNPYLYVWICFYIYSSTAIIRMY